MVPRLYAFRCIILYLKEGMSVHLSLCRSVNPSRLYKKQGNLNVFPQRSVRGSVLWSSRQSISPSIRNPSCFHQKQGNYGFGANNLHDHSQYNNDNGDNDNDDEDYVNNNNDNDYDDNYDNDDYDDDYEDDDYEDDDYEDDDYEDNYDDDNDDYDDNDYVDDDYDNYDNDESSRT